MSRTRTGTTGVLTAAILAAVGLCTAPVAGASPAAPSQAGAAAPSVIPKPVSMHTGAGHFTLDRFTYLEARSPQAVPIARDLAADLRPATGFRLPVVRGHFAHGWHGIELGIGHPASLAGHAEGYRLTVRPGGVRLVGTDAQGLFNGVQTIRQLLPGWIDSSTRRPGPWTIPDVSITDYPRFAYRGFMIDIARHYEPPSAVEKLIDIASEYKMDRLHIHLSDDQGFRVAINGFPRLTEIGGMGSVGTDGRTMDPGGFWTQQQYEQVVAYANAHFMTVVPEIDSPSHDNAIVMSEYDDVDNPLLNGDPHDILGCGINTAVPPQWNYTTAVGYSGMCWSSSNTQVIFKHIIDQLAKLSNSPYYDLGGDEATSVFTDAQYAKFVNGETNLIQAAGETPMGWAAGYATTAGTTPPTGSIAESWEPGASDAAAAVNKGMKVVMAPADHAYIDQSYPDHAGGLGLGWACGGCDLDVNYDWDPTGFSGVPDSSVIGVEAALFGETIPTLADAEFLMLPRVMAIAEIGWSPEADRSGPTSAAFEDFAARVAAQGTRLQAEGANFYTTAEVPWQLNGTGVSAGRSWHGKASGAIAVLSAPGFTPGQLTATVDWGDGTTSTATITGTAPATARVNGLYTISASHHYRHGHHHARHGRSWHGGHHTATVTVTAANGQHTTFRVRL